MKLTNYVAPKLWASSDPFLPPDLWGQIAEASAKSDETALADDACIAALREHGYFKLAIPEKFSGLGANLKESCAIQRRLGYVDGGLAIGLNMHLFTIGLMVEHWQRARDLSWMLLEGIAKKGSLVASAFAEPGLGGNLVRSYCRAEKVKGGYRLQGKKVPCSMLDRSELICLQVETDTELLVGLLPRNTAGLQVVKSRPLLGMRSSESDLLILDGTLLPDALVFHRCPPGKDDSAVFKAGMAWFCMTAVAVYCGVVARALDLARVRLNGLSIGGKPRGDQPAVQARLGVALARFTVIDSACGLLAANMESSPEESLSLALSLKQRASVELPAIVGDLMELCGGSEYAADSLLSRLLRDVQAIRFHPPTPLTTDLILGRLALGQEWNFEL